LIWRINQDAKSILLCLAKNIANLGLLVVAPKVQMMLQAQRACNII